MAVQTELHVMACVQANLNAACGNSLCVLHALPGYSWLILPVGLHSMMACVAEEIVVRGGLMTIVTVDSQLI